MSQHTNGWYIVPPLIVFNVLAIILVILRFLQRHIQRQRIGPDDVLILIAVIYCTCFTCYHILRKWQYPEYLLNT
jgi:hypothetical protein